MKIINCDLGECLIPNPDTEIMPLIGMANVACGGHVGDDKSMTETIKLAAMHGVSVGAHPSYIDRSKFGRESHPLKSRELFEAVKGQVESLRQLCVENNVGLEYIKPHGALYHDVMRNESVLHVLCDVIKEIDPNLSLVVEANSENDRIRKFEKSRGVRFLYELFADRGYAGSALIDRREKGAMLDDPEIIIQQYKRFAGENSFQIDTICFHSDNLASVEALKILAKTF
jgi:UPF0271 protein